MGCLFSFSMKREKKGEDSMLCIILFLAALIAAAAWLMTPDDDFVRINIIVTVTEGGAAQKYRTGLLVPFGRLNQHISQLCRKIHIDHGTAVTVEADIGGKSTMPRLPYQYKRQLETMLVHCFPAEQKNSQNERRVRLKRFSKITLQCE